jgi:alkylation response protein AidB-like acyl-CoA dehydrogenase
MTYRAPVEEILATLKCVGGGASDPELTRAVIEEAGRLASEIAAPINQAGDREGAKLRDGVVTTASGFREAYAAIRDGGWLGLPFPEGVGGQGLPRALGLAVMEMLAGANTSLSLCPMLSLGAVEALIAHGSEEQQRLYLPRLVSGEWTGTMNLTEPQAGSDVGALTSKAVPQADGSFLITGRKIFITWGEHDCAANIIHLVLARLPDAPPGSKGVSLFLCPKFLLDGQGEPGERNAVRCVRLEDKIGIHGSPTCEMEYVDAKAWLIGEPNRGLAAMFTMMNSARVNVGVQGVGIADAAWQAALAYASERKQGQAEGMRGQSAIIEHPDIRRTLASMHARAMAARAICYACSAAADAAEHAGDDETRLAAKRREDLLTPIAKAWSTDAAVENASLGVQVHGGMGFMAETLAAQYYRDARIGPIYEGTNGIQAIDLIGRKLTADGGAAIRAMLGEIGGTAKRAAASDDQGLKLAADCLARAASDFAGATEAIVTALREDRRRALFGATRYLKLAGDVIGAHFLIRIALETELEGAAALASFFAQDALGAPAETFTGLARAAEAADRAIGAAAG